MSGRAHNAVTRPACREQGGGLDPSGRWTRAGSLGSVTTALGSGSQGDRLCALPGRTEAMGDATGYAEYRMPGHYTP